MNKQIENEGLDLAYMMGKADGIKQGRAEAIEEVKGLEHLGKFYSEIRAEVIDECIKALKSYGECDLADKITLLEQLKEQK